MNSNLKLTFSVLLGCFLSAVLACSGYCGLQVENLPKMYIRKTTVDLGEVYEGVDIKSAFIIRNNGIGELRIKVRPG